MENSKRERLSELYEKYSGLMYRTALSLLHEPQDAMDAVQDTFIRLMQCDVVLDDEKRAKALLITAVKNRSRDLIRCRHIPVPIDNIDETAENSTAISGGETYELIKSLPENLRRTVVLRYIYGMTANETATMLGIRPAVVRSRIRVSRKLMKEQMSA